jgi:hypothetical protein
MRFQRRKIEDVFEGEVGSLKVETNAGTVVGSAAVTRLDT